MRRPAHPRRLLTIMRKARLSLLLVPSTLLACASIYGLTDVPTQVDAGSTDGSQEAPPGDASDGGPGDSSPSCPSTGWPGPPTGVSSDGGDVPPFVLAAQGIDLDPHHAIGLDLDGVCTCPGPESCVLPSKALADASCDNPAGVDPVLNRVLQQFGQLYCVPLAQSVAMGYSNILFRISGYNGLPDDDQVGVELFVSIGTPPIDDAGTPTPPRLDGTDVWLPWEPTVSNSLSLYVDLSAYVSGSVLVARPEDVQGNTLILWRLAAAECDSGLPPLLGVNPLLLAGRGIVVTGKLVAAPGGGFSLQNALAGARTATDGTMGFLQALNLFGLCPSDLRYQGAASLVCPSRDIASSPTLDNKNAPCDAVSFAIGFEATPAILGDAAPLLLQPPCSDASTVCGP
jgi:hypothetical protein